MEDTLGQCYKDSTSVTESRIADEWVAGNTNRGGRLSTIDLLIKVVRFVKR